MGRAAMLLGATALASACSRKEPAPEASPPAFAPSATTEPSTTATPAPPAAPPSLPQPKVLAQGLSSPNSLAVGTDTIYVSVTGTPTDALTVGSIFAIPKAGGTATALASKLEMPHSLALGPDGNTLYWATLNAAFKMPTKGGPPQRIYAAVGNKGVDVAGVDATRVYLAWSAGAKEGGLVSMPKTGGAPTSIYTGGPMVFARIGGSHAAVCSGPAVGQVWTKPPFTQEVIQEFGTDVCDSLAFDEPVVYWSQGGKVHSSAAPARTMVNAVAKALATQGDYLYWTQEMERDSWRIARTPKVLGVEVQEIAKGLPNVTSMALDGENIYWTDAPGGTVAGAPLPK